MGSDSQYKFSFDFEFVKTKISKELDNLKATLHKESIKLNLDLDIKPIKSAVSELNKLQDLNMSKRVLNSEITTYLAKNTALSKELKNEFISLQSTISTVDNPSGLKNLESELKILKLSAEELNQTGRSFGDEFKNSFTKLFSSINAGAVFSTAVKEIKKMISNVYEIDASMANLYKVTNETDLKYNEFLNNANAKSKELGRNISDLITQTSNWAKLGYSMDDAFTLAETSSIYTNIFNTDDAAAISNLATIMKAFNMEAKNSMTIVDSLNVLGKKYATSSTDLGTGLVNSASSLKAAGNTIHESLAMLAGGTDITQDANEMGDAISVLSLRLRGMSGELQKIGEDYENIGTVNEIQTKIYNLTNGSVNMKDNLDPTKFKSTYEIMRNIANVWSDISQADQSALLEIIAGDNYSSNIDGLIKSFQSGQVQNALTDSMNSKGSGMKEMERSLQSLEAKTQQFETAFQSLSQTLVDSNLLKFFIDLGTTGVSSLDAVISKVGTFPALMTAISAGLSAFKNVGRPTYTVGLH